jgi:predicted nuclease of predicted toxin-antitoxin system
MKVLLDENLPKRLKADLSMFEVVTVREKGWQGRENGELIRAMLTEGYQALLTFDKNLQYQQNFARYPVTVLLLNAKDNLYATLRPLAPKVVAKLNENPGAGVFEIRPD